MNVQIMPGTDEQKPHNIEAEQQILAAILLNNDLAPRAAAVLTADDFYEPVHGLIYSTALEMIDRDELVSPVTLRGRFAGTEALRELGGDRYLVRLAGAAISMGSIGEYARIVKDAAHRRALLDVISDTHHRLIRGEGRLGDITAALQTALVSLDHGDSRLRPRSLVSAMTTALEQMNSAYQGEPIAGIVPPWGELSHIMPVMRAGDMVVIGGRPSMGKSSVALSIATAAARAGHPVVIASLEMSPEDMAFRALSEATSEAGSAVPVMAMSNGDITEAQFRQTQMSAKDMSGLPVSFLSEDFRKPAQVLAGVRAALNEMVAPDSDLSRKTPLIVIDYMQLMDGPGRDLREQITEISKQMKFLARSLNAVNISLSQLSRAVESRNDKRPMLSDLRESGQLEQDADAVIFCYRDEYYIERSRPDPNDLEAFARWQEDFDRARNWLELIVAKQRRGPIGTANLRYAAAFNRIWED